MVLALVLGGAPGAAAKGPPSPDSLEKVTLQLKWRHQFQFAGYYAAVAQGFYRQAGLEVSLREADSDQDPAQAVLQGQAEYGVSTSDLVLLRGRGEPVVVLAAIFQHSPLVFLAAAGRGVDSVHDLVGRKVALESGAAELLAYLEREGIDPALLAMVSHAFGVEDLLAGKVAAISAYVTDEPFALKSQGLPFLIFSPRAAGIDFYGDTLFTTERELREHPGRVERFRAASLKGWRYALDHPDQIIDLILSSYSRRHSREHLAYEAQATRRLILPEVVELGHVNPGRWRHIAEAYAELGKLPQGVDLTGFIYRDPTPGEIGYLWGLLSGALFLLLLAVLAILHYRRLNRSLKEEAAAREEAQAELRKRERLFRGVFDILPIGLWIADQEGKLQEGNPAGVAIWGGSPLVGRSDYGVFRARRLPSGEEIAPEDWALAHTVREGVTIKDEHLEIDAFDGVTRSIINFTAPVLDDAGQVQAAIVVNQDITERRQAEEALRQSEEIFRLTFHTSPDSININRLSDGLYVDINEGFTRLTGYTREDVIGLTSLELDIWADPADRARLVAGLKEKGYYENLEARFRRKDGSHLTGLMSARIINLGGEPHLISIVRDISEIKKAQDERDQMEAQLRQAQKMEALGTLAGGIAHDFNNILGAITGYTELALEAGPGEVAAGDYLRQVLFSTQRARDLVRNILAFSRKTETDFRPLDLNQEVSRAATILERTIPRMVEVRLELVSGPALIRGDASQIQQVLLNLGSNAQDAMPQGGRLTLRTSRPRLGEGGDGGYPGVPAGEYVCLEVSDTGQGIDPDTLEQIFDPFFTTKEVGSGTGLGLAMVYGTIKGHHGHVTCQSRPGEGTTFQLLFPALEGDLPLGTESGAEPGDLSGRGETILLVDDEPALREIGGQLLTQSGYRVVPAASGEEALDIYGQPGEEIDLVLLDIGMPGMGGHRCLERLLVLDPGVRVVIASGYSKIGSIEDALVAGATDFVAKPFTSHELLAKLRAALDGRPPRA